MKVKKYVQVGCGVRSLAYSIPLVKKYEDCGELCGVYDTNYKRAELVSELAGEKIPVYDDFDKMVETVAYAIEHKNQIQPIIIQYLK